MQAKDIKIGHIYIYSHLNSRGNRYGEYIMCVTGKRKDGSGQGSKFTYIHGNGPRSLSAFHNGAHPRDILREASKDEILFYQTWAAAEKSGSFKITVAAINTPPREDGLPYGAY